MELKKPLSLDEQINQLKNHNMKICDENSAIEFLKEVNYYRFSGYALENRINEHDSNYKQNTVFENVQKRYSFDEEIRNILRKYIEIIEVYYRTQISYNFSLKRCSKPPYDQHYCSDNYSRKEDFNKLLEQILQQEEYFKDTKIVKHHKQKYKNKMPLWVLVELMTFSTLSKFFACMIQEDQELIANSVKTTGKILKNNLHCLSILRNKCAHASRIYGTEFSLPCKFGRNFLQKHPQVRQNSLFAYIIMIANRLPKERQKSFCNEITDLMEKYKSSITLSQIGFAEDYKKLLER